MSEKRFSVRLRRECDGVVYSFFDGDKLLDVDMIVDVLNEQQDTISQLKEENEQLRQQLKEKQEEEQLYANEILELREANKEFIQFKELGGDY